MVGKIPLRHGGECVGRGKGVPSFCRQALEVAAPTKGDELALEVSLRSEDVDLRSGLQLEAESFFQESGDELLSPLQFGRPELHENIRASLAGPHGAGQGVGVVIGQGREGEKEEKRQGEKCFFQGNTYYLSEEYFPSPYTRRTPRRFIGSEVFA